MIIADKSKMFSVFMSVLAKMCTNNAEHKTVNLKINKLGFALFFQNVCVFARVYSLFLFDSSTNLYYWTAGPKMRHETTKLLV